MLSLKTSRVPWRNLIPVFVLIPIFLLALALRFNTFWLPHWQGDQSQYLALAMKLGTRGIQDYNLRGVRIGFLTPKENENWGMAYVEHHADDERGDLVRSYEMLNLEFYGMPFFYKAPLFPVLLASAHRWLTRGNHPFLIVKSNLGRTVGSVKPTVFFNAQFWAVIVPLGVPAEAVALQMSNPPLGLSLPSLLRGSPSR